MGCEPDIASDQGDKIFSLVDEVIYDAPIKAQITQHIVVSSIPTPSQIERELLRRYSDAKYRRGFRHHVRPTNIFLYIYGSDQQAREEHLWLAMLAKGPLERQGPRVIVDNDRLAALSAPPVAVLVWLITIVDVCMLKRDSPRQGQWPMRHLGFRLISIDSRRFMENCLTITNLRSAQNMALLTTS